MPSGRGTTRHARAAAQSMLLNTFEILARDAQDKDLWRRTLINGCFFSNGELPRPLHRKMHTTFILFIQHTLRKSLTTNEHTSRSRQTMETPQLTQTIERMRPYAPDTAWLNPEIMPCAHALEVASTIFS